MNGFFTYFSIFLSLSLLTDRHKLRHLFESCYFLHTALQTNLGVSFESTMTFISENVTLNFTESNEVVKKKIYIALFEKIDFFHFWLKIMSCCKN